MENPNEYDDKAWSDGNNAVTRAVSQFWLAGASVEEISEAIKNGFDQVDAGADVDIGLVPLSLEPHAGGGPKNLPKPSVPHVIVEKGLGGGKKKKIVAPPKPKDAARSVRRPRDRP